MDFTVTQKQGIFLQSTADEVFFGGAAGGGKSYIQLLDAFRYAVTYFGSKQLILRRTFPELNRSMVVMSREMYPTSRSKKDCLCWYNKSEKKWYFQNGSFIEFGYCESDADVNKYQSAEYDVIRFDEVTHFTEYQYTYLISRVRGSNLYPKQMKSTGNPGGIGHSFIKNRFIDQSPPMTEFEIDNSRRIFIPAMAKENRFLMEKDPEYIRRLEQLPEIEKQRLLYGDWDVFEGRFFTEFSRDTHVIRPFEVPPYWNKFISLDYGLDMTAALWWAVDEQGRAYVYRELYEPNLNLSQAAKRIAKESKKEYIMYIVASPDLWNRRQETGKSGMEIMTGAGLKGLIRADDRRVQGWRNVREWLQVFKDEHGIERPYVQIFNSCQNLIRCLPLLQHDKKNNEDCAKDPHEITHAPESFRYGIMSRPIITKTYAQKISSFNFEKEPTEEYEEYGYGDDFRDMFD